jgi:hypothetical protein
VEKLNMTAQARLKAALRSPDPGPALRAVVQDLAREGLTKPQIYELLETLRAQLRMYAE